MSRLIHRWGFWALSMAVSMPIVFLLIPVSWQAIFVFFCVSSYLHALRSRHLDVMDKLEQLLYRKVVLDDKLSGYSDEQLLFLLEVTRDEIEKRGMASDG